MHRAKHPVHLDNMLADAERPGNAERAGPDTRKTFNRAYPEIIAHWINVGPFL